MEKSTRNWLVCSAVALAGVTGAFAVRHHPKQPAAPIAPYRTARAAAMSSLSPISPKWQASNPPLVPEWPSELDDYLEKVVAHARSHPETASESLDLALDVIAKLGSPSGDLQEIVDKQNAFTEKMQEIVATLPPGPTQLPEDVASALDQIKNAKDPGTRKDLASALVRRLSNLPAGVQTAALTELAPLVED